MKIVRFQVEGRSPRNGWIHEDEVGVVDGSPFERFSRREADIQLDDVTLLAPLLPGKIVCVGRNYAAHASERNAVVPDMPLIFLKPPSAVVGPEQSIVLPPQSNHVEHEAELGVVIGRSGRWIDPADALDHVFGYCVANDVTARDLQRADSQWSRAKGFDTFCPLGEMIPIAEIDTDGLSVISRVNGEERQRADVGQMVFSIPFLIAYVSRIMTLERGDLIATGTPEGVGPLKAGDVVEVEIPGLATLTNPVVERKED